MRTFTIKCVSSQSIESFVLYCYSVYNAFFSSPRKNEQEIKDLEKLENSLGDLHNKVKIGSYVFLKISIRKIVRIEIFFGFSDNLLLENRIFSSFLYEI